MLQTGSGIRDILRKLVTYVQQLTRYFSSSERNTSELHRPFAPALRFVSQTKRLATGRWVPHWCFRENITTNFSNSPLFFGFQLGTPTAPGRSDDSGALLCPVFISCSQSLPTQKQLLISLLQIERLCSRLMNHHPISALFSRVLLHECLGISLLNIRCRQARGETPMHSFKNHLLQR